MEHKNMTYSQYGPTILRIFLGLLFLVPGIFKITNPAGIIGMLGGLGFPLATFFGWLVILSEIGFGLALLLGYKVKYTVWPLIVIMIVAIFSVTLPGFIKNPTSAGSLLFHLLAIGGLLSVYFTGPGKCAVNCKSCRKD